MLDAKRNNNLTQIKKGKAKENQSHNFKKKLNY